MEEYPLYLEVSPQGVALSVLAMLSLLVCIPPLIWHSRNGNFPAACLAAWLIVLNFFNFANPLIWPTDEMETWWNGYVYCDINTKIYTGAGVGVAGPLVCIFRSLAKVLDTDRSSLVPSKAQKRRNLAFEVVFCVVIPIIIMIVHYVVQNRRYFILGIVGCFPAYYPTWVSAVASYIWPPIILLIATIYCLIVLYRLAKYRSEFSSIMSINPQTTTSRFVRLLSLSLVMLLGSFPVQLYVLYMNLTTTAPVPAYTWENAHGPDWGDIDNSKVPASGMVQFDPWIHVTAGFLLFVFFGFGKDATMMYRSILLKLGLGRVFPSLKHPHIFDQRKGSASSSTRFGSIGSRAKLFFRKMSSSGNDTMGTCDMTVANMSMEGIATYDAPNIGSSISSGKPLPKAPRRDIPQYPHLEVWPPSPSETMIPDLHHGRSISSEASTAVNYPPNPQNQLGGGMRGNSFV